jgi:hypothetical protein
VTENCSPIASAWALVTLLNRYPRLNALTWTVDPAGVLHGAKTDADEGGRIVDDCARFLGGTAIHATVARGSDRVTVAELATVWKGVPVDVYATYSDSRCARPLGTLPLSTPGGDR